MSLQKTIYIVVLAGLLVLAMTGCSPTLSMAGAVPKLPGSENSVASAPIAQTGPTPAAVAQTNSGITVVGVGQVSGSPDIARVVIGVETQGNEIKKAITDNNTNMTALLKSLKAAGLSDKDIQTMNYNLSVENPNGQITPTDQTATKPVVIYHVSNQVQVTVRDLTKLSDILDQSVTSGANTIYGVSFDVSDPAKLEDQARTLAVADAKARAGKLAQLEGVTLGNVVLVNEITANPGPVYANAYALGKGGGGAPIEGGSIQITVNVQVTYTLK